jgi:hypothetical protein
VQILEKKPLELKRKAFAGNYSLNGVYAELPGPHFYPGVSVPEYKQKSRTK